MSMARTHNQGLNEEIFSYIVNGIQKSVALNNFKISIAYLAPGKAGLKMDVGEEYSNSRGTAHGGIIAALVDSSMGISIITLGFRVMTLELNLNYLAPVKIGDQLSSEGRVVHIGKNTAVAEAEVFNCDQNLIAKSRGTFFLDKPEFNRGVF